jgi:hypothetical protein
MSERTLTERLDGLAGWQMRADDRATIDEAIAELDGAAVELNLRDMRISELESTNARLVEERDALHKALDLVLMLTYRDVRELNAYGTAIKALLPGYRAGLGITVAFADDVKKALASAGERRDG